MRLLRKHPLTLALRASFTPDKGGEGLSPPAGRGETRAFSFPPDLSVDDAVEDDESTS